MDAVGEFRPGERLATAGDASEAIILGDLPAHDDCKGWHAAMF
jgi:hypothetical protein